MFNYSTSMTKLADSLLCRISAVVVPYLCRSWTQNETMQKQRKNVIFSC